MFPKCVSMKGDNRRGYFNDSWLYRLLVPDSITEGSVGLIFSTSHTVAPSLLRWVPLHTHTHTLGSPQHSHQVHNPGFGGSLVSLLPDVPPLEGSAIATLPGAGTLFLESLGVFPWFSHL